MSKSTATLAMVPSGEDNAAVAGACLHADSAQPGQVVTIARKRLLVAQNVGIQLFGGGVLLADFTDFAAQTNRHAGRLQLADKRRQFG